MEQTQTSPHGLFANGHHATSDPPFSCQSAVPQGMYAATPDWKPAKHPSTDDWETVKARIHDMYVLQKKSLKATQGVLLAEYGFKASERMIKSRLKGWGFVKNAKREDWGLLAVLHDRRKNAGKHNTVFNVHGHRKTVKDLHRFIRNQNQSVEQFLDEYRDMDVVPDHIRAWTPEPEDDIRPDSPPPSAIDRPTELYSPSPPKSLPVPISSEPLPGILTAEQPPALDLSPSHLRPNHFGTDPYRHRFDQYHQSNASEFGQSPHVPARINTSLSASNLMQIPPQIPTPPLSEPCHQMDAELEACGTQLLKPQRLVSKVGMNDLQLWSWIYQRHEGSDQPDMDVVQICSRCKQPSQRHFRSLDNFEPAQDSSRPRYLLNDCDNRIWHLPVSTRDEGAWLWVSRCFLACMCFSRGDDKMGLRALDDAVAHLEKLLKEKDRLLLTAAVLMTAILHMHDQSNIAFKILRSAKEAADRHFEDETHPIRVTMAYFMHSANDSFGGSHITSTTMEAAYLRLRASYRPEHPYVIAARTNYGWMLKYEDKLEAAESHLKEVYRASCRVFGEDHMQSIIALSLIAGCLRPQSERRPECVGLYRAVIKKTEDILGVSHPYRLEAKRRLAEKLAESGVKEGEVLQLHKDVLWGRAKMLGRLHNYTSGAKRVYEENLKEIGKWVDDRTGEPTGERVEIEDLFAQDPQDAWVSVGGGNSVLYTLSNEVEDDDSRHRFQSSMLRTPSPTKSDDYAAY